MLKILSIRSIMAAILLICVILSACGGGGGNGPSGTLKIGVILTLSGNGSAAGDYTLKGIQLAVKEQNAKGGLLGRQIALDVQDSKGDPKTGIDIIKRMLETDARPFMVCSNTSGVSLAIKPETERSKVILLASAATDKLLEDGSYTLRNYADSTQLAGAIMDVVGAQPFGVFYSNNEFGSSVSRKIAERSSAPGGPVRFNVPYDEKDLDYKSLISAQDIKDVSSIYVVGLGKSLGAFVKQLREAGYSGQIIGDPLFNNPDTMAAAGAAAEQITLLDFGFDPTSTAEPVAGFVKAYRADFSTDPANLSAITYDAVNHVFRQISQRGVVEGDDLMAALRNGTITNGVSGTSTISGGNINYPLVLDRSK